MKRSVLLTIPLLLIASAFGGSAARAEESGTIYPDEAEIIKPLEFEALTDYAVSDGAFAFAEGDTAYVYEDGALSLYRHTAGIAALDYDGCFFFSDNGGGTFSLPEGLPAEHEFQTFGEGLTVGNYYYYFDDSGELTVCNLSEKTFGTLDGFTNPKLYSGTLYATCGNALYSLEGETATEIRLEYCDFSSTKKIAVGQTGENLVNYTLQFVTVNADSFLTEIDLTSLDGEYFASGATKRAAERTTALLLCYTGNAALISVGDTAYITLAVNVAPADADASWFSDVDYVQFKDGKATVTGDRIYASPYVITGTASVDFLDGQTTESVSRVVTILRKITSPVLGSAFYEVEYYGADGQAMGVGYVAEGLLTELIFENSDLNVITDPDYSENNDVRTALLVFAVVVLVIIAAGYLTYVGTSGKKKKERKKADKNDKNADKEVNKDSES